MGNLFKKYAWHLAIILSALLITLAFVPQILDNKEIKQHDILQSKGAVKEMMDYKAQDGKIPLWSNSMFSGMPMYLAVVNESNIFSQVNIFFRKLLPSPADLIFLTFLGFIAMGFSMRLKPWATLLGAIAYTFSTYNIVIVAAGHNAKLNALAFLPVIFGGLYHAYRINPMRGAAIFGIGLVLNLVASHPQMTYYFGFLGLAFVASEAVAAFKTKQSKNFLIASALLACMTLLAGLSHYSNLATITDYSKYSTRSQSELSLDAENQTSGLDKDYITDWSNGIDESFSLLIPNYKGAASGQLKGHPSALKNVDKSLKATVGEQNAYWGDQPFIGGPAYAGAFIVVLFFFGLILIKDRIKWPLLIAATITLILSWGKHVPGITDFCLEYLPMYSKFRAVASMIVIPDLVIPILASIVVVKIADSDLRTQNIFLFGKDTGKTPLQAFLIVSGIFALFCAITWIAPTTFNSVYSSGEYENFSQSIDMQFARDIQNGMMSQGELENFKSEFFAQLEKARSSILKADALRSLFIILIGMVIVGLYLKKPYNKAIFAAALILLTMGDLFTINKRYLNDSHFARKKSGNDFPIRMADQVILADKGHNNRVLNLSLSTFNDATTSYYHKSIGGYYAAKMKKYQELIQYALQPEIQNISTALQVNPTVEGLDSAMRSNVVLNMLNTKYVIFDPNNPPYVNPHANGNAWFVEEVKIVENADEELALTKSSDLKRVAITQQSFASMVEGHKNGRDTTAYIELSSYHPTRMEYTAHSSEPKLAVFSEIWYPEWKVSIDGQPIEVAKVNYTLRAMVVPPGTHKIEMQFETKYWERGKISLAGSSLLLLCSLLFLFGAYIPGLKKYYNKDAEA